MSSSAIRIYGKLSRYSCLINPLEYKFDFHLMLVILCLCILIAFNSVV